MKLSETDRFQALRAFRLGAKLPDIARVFGVITETMRRHLQLTAEDRLERARSRRTGDFSAEACYARKQVANVLKSLEAYVAHHREETAPVRVGRPSSSAAPSPLDEARKVIRERARSRRAHDLDHHPHQ